MYTLVLQVKIKFNSRQGFLKFHTLANTLHRALQLVHENFDLSGVDIITSDLQPCADIVSVNVIGIIPQTRGT